MASSESGAAARRESLHKLATRMLSDVVELDELISEARRALERADAARVSTRHVSPAAIVEYAERVSYSSAAPLGAAAFEGARRQGWYQGWGTPAPQQHMLANAHFAPGRPAASAAPRGPASQSTAAGLDPAASEARAAPAAAAAPTAVTVADTRPHSPGASGPASTLTFTHTAGVAASAGASERAHVSLELNSDESSEDDFA
jgi:hypothetical protein